MRSVVPDGLIRCLRTGVLAAPATFLLLASGFVLLVIGFAGSSDSAEAPVVVPVVAVSPAQGAPGDAGTDPSGDYAVQQAAVGNASAAKPSQVNNSGGSAKRITGSTRYQQTADEMAAKSGRPTPETVNSTVPETPVTRPSTQRPTAGQVNQEEPQIPVAVRAADQRPTAQQAPVDEPATPVTTRRQVGQAGQAAEEVPVTPVVARRQAGQVTDDVPSTPVTRRKPGETADDVPATPVSALAAHRQTGESAEDVPASPVATVAARRQTGGAVEEVPTSPVATVAGRRVADARPTGPRVDGALADGNVRRAIRAATATAPADEDLPGFALTRADARGSQAGQASPGRKVPGQDVRTLLDGGADVVSGIVGTVAGKRAGEATHEVLSGVADDVTRALRVGTRLAGGEQSSSTSSLPDVDRIRDTAQRQVDTALRQVGERLDEIGENGAGKAKGLFLKNAGTAPGCAKGERCGPVTEQARTMLAGGTGTRGPPARTTANPTTEDQTYQLTAFDPQAQRAAQQANDQALNDRLAVINGQRGLDDAKKQLDTGKLTQAEYDKKVAAQKTLQTTSDASMTKVSPENAELIDYVINGQQQLGPQQAALDKRGKDLDAAWDAQRRNLAAGKFDIPGLVNTAIASGQYRRDLAEFDRYRDDVNVATDQLRGLTGHDDITLGDPGRNGVACGSSGAFSRCEGASFGQQESCQGLAGVSACNVSVGSGSTAASGKCPIDGSGCTSAATFGGHTASSGCKPGAYCETTATADWSGAYSECEAAKGCTGDSTARQGSADQSSGDQKREVSTATGKCEGDCGLWASAGADGVGEAHCQAGGGACDTDSTSTRTAPQPLAAAGTGQTGADRQPAASGTGQTGPNGQPVASETAGPGTNGTPSPGTNGSPGAGTNGTPGAGTNGTPGAGQDPRGRTARASSHCESNTGQCATFATTDTNTAVNAGVNSAASARAGADVDCGGKAGCAGTGSTRSSTDAASGTGAKRHGETKSDCVVAAGSCHAGDQARADNPLRPGYWPGAVMSSVPGAWFGEPGGPAWRTVDGDASGEGTAQASVDCAGVTGCSGAAHTRTAASVTTAPTEPGKPGATRETHGRDSCLVTSADGCTSQSHSRADDQLYPTQWLGYRDFGTGSDYRDFGGYGWSAPSSPASTSPAPAGSGTSSGGSGTGVGAGSGTGPGAGHGGTGSRLDAHAGGTQLTGSGAVVDHNTATPDQAANGTTRTRGPPAPARQVSASSQAGSQIDCSDPSGCDASSISQTGGSASGDVPYRDSTGESSCNLRSATGCTSHSTTQVSNRTATPDSKIAATPDTPSDDQRTLAPGSAPLRQGEPVATSHATAEGGCPLDATGCTSQTCSATTSRNTAVSDRRTGSDATANCAGGPCVTPSHSDASTEPDYVVYDGATRKPLAEQPTRGATSNSGSNARAIPTNQPTDQQVGRPGDQDDPKTAPVRPVAQVSNWFNNGANNHGNGNNGNNNSGFYNTGDNNLGDHNKGNANVGNHNVGNGNTGNQNLGNANTGNQNVGNANNGNANVGNGNRGNANRGNGNTGNANQGNFNIGDSNVGSRNIGNANHGSYNNGSGNQGSYNNGNGNQGSYNAGSGNRGSYNIGNANVGSHNVGNANHGSYNVGSGNRGNRNVGNGNVGSHNVGSANHGSFNIGDANSGSSNRGSGNIGSYNVGSGNRGNHNVGNANIGNYNRGNANVGNHNVGNANQGSYNVGNGNRGNHNVGNGNVGNGNVGSGNVGSHNVGNANHGSHNVGNGNRGNYNVGDANVGNYNRGNGNVGNHNVGNHNVGNGNRGDYNRGNGNIGNRNFGNGNRGNDNRGDGNIGNANVGNYNRGDGNHGSYNVGNYNNGSHNVGNHNVGDRNRGDYNRGNDNVGNRNVGNANHGDDNVGNNNIGNRNHGNSNKGNDNVGDRNVGNANRGNDNHGDRNVGNANHGNDNIGNRNKGNNNHGDDNQGNNNTGNRNVGNHNKGDDNHGNRNVGNRNIGDDNKGNDNVGNRNVGNNNTGDDNVGNENVGNRNHGHRNVGDDNRGDDNIGNRNAGNRNIGDDNHGDDNIGDRNHGNRNHGNDNRGNDNTGNNNHGDRNNGNNNRGNDHTGNNQQGQAKPPNYGMPLLTQFGVGVDLTNNFPRAIGTYKDAATRHGHWAEVFRDRAQSARASGNHALARTYDRLAAWRENRAGWYQRQSASVDRFTNKYLPEGNRFTNWARKFLPATGADNLNRTPRATLNERYGSGSKPSQAIKSFGGAEWLRRGATKVSGLFGIPAAIADGVYGVTAHGESVPHAVGRTGSSLLVGTAGGALATAGVAAVVPGAGWAVAGGIVAGAYIGDVWSRSGAADKVGQGFEKAGDAFGRGDVLGGLGEGAKGVAQGVGAFGKQIGSDLASAGRWVGGLFS